MESAVALVRLAYGSAPFGACIMVAMGLAVIFGISLVGPGLPVVPKQQPLPDRYLPRPKKRSDDGPRVWAVPLAIGLALLGVAFLLHP